MQTFNKREAIIQHAPEIDMQWTGTPEIRFTINCDTVIKPGDRIKMGKVKDADGNPVTVYYEITEIVEREPSLFFLDDLITANAQRILV